MTDDTLASAKLAIEFDPVLLRKELPQLLDRVELFIRRYVVLDESQATAAALWVLHTWAMDAAQATPYLFINSAEPECGKTRLLEVLHELVRAPLFTMNVSDAALFRAIETLSPTLIFDEVDSVFNPKARERGEKRELQSLINAGYRRGGFVLRMGGANRTTLERFGVFGPKALAGLGSLPPTLASRCLRLELKRRRVDERVEDFYPQEVAAEANSLRERLEAWAAVSLDTLRAARPERVDGLRDRTNEVWRPLLAIAELGGAAWSAKARRAAVALAAGLSDDEVSYGVLLLDDIHTVFDERQAERLATAELIAALAEREESPWGEWWLDKDGGVSRSAARRLAQLLRPFGIHSKDVRTNGTKKGYKREDFLDAWERFLAAGVQGRQGRQGRQPAPHKQTVVADVADVADRRQEPEATLDERLLDETAALISEGIVTEARTWECPCGREEPKPGKATPVKTLVSLMVPKCPHCGRGYRPEWRVA